MSLHNPQNPLLALGMASLVLGFIGLLLFFMPILGIPIALFGLAFGLVGVVVAIFATGPALRWSLGGTLLCGLAVTVNVAVNSARKGYLLPSRSVPALAAGTRPPSGAPAR